MPDPPAASRPELLHRDHVLHELIDGNLSALLKARRFVLLEVRFIPVHDQLSESSLQTVFATGLPL